MEESEDDEEIDEDDMMGDSVSYPLSTCHFSEIQADVHQTKVTTPSAKRRRDKADAKKAATAARKADISEIGKRRSAIEGAKVSFFARHWRPRYLFRRKADSTSLPIR